MLEQVMELVATRQVEHGEDTQFRRTRLTLRRLHMLLLVVVCAPFWCKNSTSNNLLWLTGCRKARCLLLEDFRGRIWMGTRGRCVLVDGESFHTVGTLTGWWTATCKPWPKPTTTTCSWYPQRTTMAAHWKRGSPRHALSDHSLTHHRLQVASGGTDQGSFVQGGNVLVPELPKATDGA